MADILHVELSKLILDTSKLNPSYIAYETDSERIPSFTHSDLINDWHIEHIRRFNVTAEYLINSLQRVSIFGQMLTDGKTKEGHGNTTIDIIKEHRAACREACINIDIYIEKIKSFCRYYFFMDRKLTDDGKKWVETLMQYKDIEGWSYIQSFLIKCQILWQDADTKFLIDVRNDEIHNESPLELMQYRFADDDLVPVIDTYVIPIDVIHNKITHTIETIVSITVALQDILNNISPFSVYSYLSPRNGHLKNIIKMEDRYKLEREYIRRFYCI
ncbi:MAG: hypothetical protein IJF40_00645 [Clostridia bacterium]|nr:hypothetical protein [Clostridia bacterium]